MTSFPRVTAEQPQALLTWTPVAIAPSEVDRVEAWRLSTWKPDPPDPRNPETRGKGRWVGLSGSYGPSEAERWVMAAHSRAIVRRATTTLVDGTTVELRAGPRGVHRLTIFPDAP